MSSVDDYARRLILDEAARHRLDNEEARGRSPRRRRRGRAGSVYGDFHDHRNQVVVDGRRQPPDYRDWDDWPRRNGFPWYDL